MNKRNAQGFTLVELLVVIAIIGLLAGLLVPLAGRGADSAKKKRAALEANSLAVAVTQYHDDHHFMPSTDSKKVASSDLWIKTDDKEWLAVVQGDNALKQNYLTVKMNDDGTFPDPWGNPYRVGMDRNLDGRVDASSGGKVAQQPVVAVSCGPDGAYGTDDDISTCEWK